MLLTATTMLIGSIAMMLSFVLIRHRINQMSGANTYQASQMAGFFFNISLFFVLMFIPNLALANNPGKFPAYMAIGYVVGHVFSYVSLIYMLRMLCSMVPRLTDKTTLVTFIAAVYATVLTIVNAITMIWGVQPTFDSNGGITLFHANPVVGVGIIIFGAVSILPTAVLMIINGFRNPHARLRSFLLGGGLLIMILAGPIHDVARSAGLYATADAATTIGLLVVATGVMYRIEEKIVLSRRLAASAQA